MRRVILLGVLLASATAFAQASSDVTIIVGKSTRLSLGPVSISICDDPSIVKIEDGGDALVLKGLKVGQTQCGFWTRGGTQHTLVTVTVTEPPPPEDPNAGRPDGGTRPN